jgi:predicted RNase H-like HicB family nuclease
VSEYVIVIDDAGPNFSAHAPDVAGCVATGRTVEETVANMREALAFHFDGLRADGLAVPPPSTRAAVIDIG